MSSGEEERRTEDTGTVPKEVRNRKERGASQPRKAWITSHPHQELGQRQGTDAPLELPEGTTLADSLISDSWPPELRENKLLFGVLVVKVPGHTPTPV